MGSDAFRVELDALMRTRRLSQSQVGRLAGCDHSLVSRVLVGSRSFSPGMLDRLAEGLGLSDDETFRLHLLAVLPHVPHRYHARVLAVLATGTDRLDADELWSVVTETVVRQVQRRERQVAA